MGSVGVVGHHVLVVDDDPTVSDVVRRYLEQDGCRVRLAADGLAALAAVAAEPPDLVVLDLMLGGIDGLEVCRRLRRDLPDLPVVMLTALGEEADRVVGLEVGADDYVTKPFSVRELVLRVRSVLRRAAPSAEDHRIAVEFLLRHPARAWSRAQLLEQVWGWQFGDQSTVTVHVRRLREKIEVDAAAPVRLLTVWGVGYRYELAGHA